MINSINAIQKNQNLLFDIMKKLSSGKNINSASDNPAGLAFSTRLESLSNSSSSAMRNVQDGVSMLKTAESAASNITDSLNRMRDLAVRANNGTLSASDKQVLQKEFDELKQEIDRTSNTTSFNNNNLLDGSTPSVNIQAGDSSSDVIAVSTPNTTSTSLGIDTLDISSDAETAISSIDSALDTISNARADMGSSINKLETRHNTLASEKINYEQTRARIQDADYAAQASELVKVNILNQAAIKSQKMQMDSSSIVMQLIQG